MESQINSDSKGDVFMSKKTHVTNQEYIDCINYIYNNEPVTFEQVWVFISSFDINKSQKIELINEILNSTLVLYKNNMFFMR